MISLSIIKKPDFAKIAKNVTFGTAVGLTKTAKDGQASVVGALKSTFTIRGTWFEQRNKFGIKIRSATPKKLESQIYTLADWLKIHETGGTKTPRKKLIAIPTGNVRRNKKLIIPRGQRPAALRGKRTFVLETASGAVLFQRKFKGKRSKIVALYTLEPSAKIKKRSVFFEPITRTVKAKAAANIDAEIKKALAPFK